MESAPQDLLAKKHAGGEWTDEEIAALVGGMVEGTVAPQQVGSFTTTVLLNGMTDREIAALVTAMRDSGAVLDWAEHGVDPSRVVDKHSTGGVGDEKMSPLTTSIASAAGVRVPNLTAGGSDFMPGDTDLLEAIPGYDSTPPFETLIRQVRETGAAIMIPTPEITPADGIIYATRSITATFSCPPLIVGSIMSKKLAVSPVAIVMSIGFGSGSTLIAQEEGRELGRMLADTAQRLGVHAAFPLADYDSIVGRNIGSSLAVKEMVAFLRDPSDQPRLLDFVLTMSGEMIRAAGIAGSAEEARAVALEQIESGRALAQFGRIIAGQGGPADFVDRVDEYMPTTPVVAPVFADEAGWVAGMDCRALGRALRSIGGAVKNADGWMDHAVGFERIAAIGERVDAETPLLTVHAQTQDDWERAAAQVRAAFRIAPEAVPAAGPIIVDWVAGGPTRD